jgi:hypothetical protein
MLVPATSSHGPVESLALEATLKVLVCRLGTRSVHTYLVSLSGFHGQDEQCTIDT